MLMNNENFNKVCNSLGMVWLCDNASVDNAFSIDAEHVRVEAVYESESESFYGINLIKFYIENNTFNYNKGTPLEFNLKSLQELELFVELLKEHGEKVGTNEWRPFSKQIRELRKSLKN